MNLMEVEPEGIPISVTKGIASHLNHLGATITSKGLHLSRELSTDELGELGNTLLEARKATDVPIRFAIGKWYSEFAARHGDKESTIREILKSGNVTLNDLKHWAWVENRVPYELRFDNVTWSIFYEAASMSPKQLRDILTRASKPNNTVTVKHIKTLKAIYADEANKRANEEARTRKASELEFTPQVDLSVDAVQMAVGDVKCCDVATFEPKQNVIHMEVSETGDIVESAPVEKFEMIEPEYDPDEERDIAASLQKTGNFLAVTLAQKEAYSVIDTWLSKLYEMATIYDTTVPELLSRLFEVQYKKAKS